MLVTALTAVYLWLCNYHPTDQLTVIYSWEDTRACGCAIITPLTLIYLWADTRA